MNVGLSISLCFILFSCFFYSLEEAKIAFNENRVDVHAIVKVKATVLEEEELKTKKHRLH